MAVTDTTVRRGWLLSVASLALWTISSLTLAGYVFVVGPAGDQQQATRQFTQRPLETISEPLIALLVATLAFGALAVLSLLYYVYTQWRYARRRRRTLECGPRN